MEMKGYKALNKNMKAVYGNGMQFELGKTYSVSGEVILCKNGFHFCEKIEDISCYYGFSVKGSSLFCETSCCQIFRL